MWLRVFQNKGNRASSMDDQSLEYIVYYIGLLVVPNSKANAFKLVIMHGSYMVESQSRAFRFFVFPGLSQCLSRRSPTLKPVLKRRRRS